MENKPKSLDNLRQEEYYKFLDDFRKNNIPYRYNQIELMDELLNEELDHYISISNRTDGKSFNYIHFLIHFSIEKEIGFILVCRNWSVRNGYQSLVTTILDKSKIYSSSQIMYSRTDAYTSIHFKDRIIGIITDLSEATELKYHSNFLENFPIIVYDEFLALEGDYLMDEWVRLKTIYSSVNRKDENSIPYIKFPKIIYLGNAVNFSSPILSELKLYNILEKHQINTNNIYGNIMLEMNKNDNANEERNLRAFNETLDNMTMGEFEVNNHAIATENEMHRLKANQRIINVKLSNEYLQIKFNPTNNIIVLSVTSYVEDYDFNTKLKDNTKTSELLLQEKYYKEDHIKVYNNQKIKFENNYSRDIITDGLLDYRLLNIKKIIRRYNSLNQTKKQNEIKEEQYKDNYIEQTKKALSKKFLE